MKISVIRVNLILLAILLISFVNPGQLFAEDNIITVYCDREIGQINNKVFGNNFLGYGGRVYSDYGAGIWDPKWSESVKEVINLAKAAGTTMLRFPGGCGTHHYNWRNAIGKDREHFLYGIDEFLKTCEEIGAEAVITVSYFTGNEQDAADLVRYVKGKVRYFEIGNEVWHGDHRGIQKVKAQEYAQRYLRYYRVMKAVDAGIKIGAVLDKQQWNKEVLSLIKDRIDFGIVHIYPTPAWGKRLSKIPPEDIFGISLALPEFQYQRYITDTLRILKEYAKKDVPLAVTEFNCGFVQNRPVPYRHTLGCALVNAELLKLFMKPRNNILMANYWNFVNEYWGMIANGFKGRYEDLYKPYYKRPNFYVFEFYHQHFGDVLLDVDVKGKGYNLGEYASYLRDRYYDNLQGEVVGEDLLKNKKWEIKDLMGVNVKEDKAVLSLEFREPEEFNYYHTYKVCNVEPDSYYKISGYIKAENLKVNPEESGLRLEVQDKRGYTKTRWAKSTRDVKGTTGWVYVEKIFKTLPDAEAIKIIARRIGEKLPLRGKGFVKDVKLYKVKAEDYIVSYLSVNASKSKDGEKVYLMVVNKNLEEDIEAKIRIEGFNSSKGIARIFTLGGKRIDATNEGWPHKVKVYKKELRFSGNSFKMNFKKHSLTAIEIMRRKKDE